MVTTNMVTTPHQDITLRPFLSVSQFTMWPEALCCPSPQLTFCKAGWWYHTPQAHSLAGARLLPAAGSQFGMLVSIIPLGSLCTWALPPWQSLQKAQCITHIWQQLIPQWIGHFTVAFRSLKSLFQLYKHSLVLSGSCKPRFWALAIFRSKLPPSLASFSLRSSHSCDCGHG